jgi:catechol 2,3-dioxygenase-like lactoylglutathione lyase family enzyme
MELLANIDVDDVQVAADFYCQALNLTVGRRFGNSGIELLGASSAIYLLEKPAGTAACSAPGSSRHYSRHWTPVHLDFVVPDIHEACAGARAAGATPEGAVRTHAWGHVAVFADPFGHGFCLIQFLNRGYDEVAS